MVYRGSHGQNSTNFLTPYYMYLPRKDHWQNTQAGSIFFKMHSRVQKTFSIEENSTKPDQTAPTVAV